MFRDQAFIWFFPRGALIGLGTWSVMSHASHKVIRCTEVNCTCQCFRPGKTRVRTCDQCRHGWVAHALDKLLQPPPSSLPGTQVEVAHPGVVFDLASLVLYGATALPIRLKILLDRLLSVLTNNQVLYILETLGWTLQDYCRGYVLQGSSGDVGDRWTLVCRVEETVILQQFLRFGETRPIVELMTFQDSDANDISGPASSFKKESNIRAFIESVGPSGHLEKVTGHHFENFPPDLSILLPFQFPSSSPLLGLAPPYRLGGLRRPEKSKQTTMTQPTFT
uniref:Uncharacterized protein n=1 Tax=Esox lucius TaxID=8010 RepID=A0AAY5KS65_ESOLU